jgi:hypothetical protein
MERLVRNKSSLLLAIAAFSLGRNDRWILFFVESSRQSKRWTALGDITSEVLPLMLFWMITAPSNPRSNNELNEMRPPSGHLHANKRGNSVESDHCRQLRDVNALVGHAHGER